MTQEDKMLLIKDLSSRLPYSVHVQHTSEFSGTLYNISMHHKYDENDNIYDVLGKRTLKNYYVLTNEELEMIALNHKYIDKDVYEKFKEYFYDYVDLYRRYNLNFIKCYKKSLH